VTVRAWVGIGSNLDGPEAQVRTALEALAQLPRTGLAACSSLYRSTPMGPQDQPDFVNAVAALDTGLEPALLLAELQAVEQAQGRRRSASRWGPRTLDLDLLLYGDRVIELPGLRVPHPGMCRRDFVMIPLVELDPDLVIPGCGRLTDLLGSVENHALSRLVADS